MQDLPKQNLAELPERLIKIGELAELKAVSLDTIRRWEKEGKIRSVRTDGDTDCKFVLQIG
ncbi:MAG: MerR family DNA-binding transcriptional regulator [Brasilonema sp.]